jgi:parvulin-like peptidyl-prolyl isomerase
MKRIAVIPLILLPLAVVAQVGLQSSHQPSFTMPPASSAAPAALSTNAPTEQIVRVNGTVLTQAQIDEELQRLFPYYAIHGGRVPEGARKQLNEQAIHDAILHELVYQEARRRGLQVSPEAWQKRLAQIQSGFPSRQAYDEAAAKKYGSVAIFERRLRRAMLVEQLWASEVVRKSAVSTEEVRAYYLAHKAQYVRPEAVWLQTITINFTKSATPEEKQQARKIAEQILVKAKAAKTYEEFGVLAEKLSQDNWRVMMGDHRWVHRGAVTPDIEQAVFSLKAGETSGVVESSTGYIILRANDHQTKRQMTLAEMTPMIRKSLETEKFEKRSSQFEAALRKNAKVEML